MAEKYEVVIIGAGPAGLECARTLAEGGKKVLVLERNLSIIPRKCSGTLTNKDINFKLPESNKIRFNKIYLHFPKGEVTIGSKKLPLVTLDRCNLKKYLFELSKESGAEIRVNSPVLSIEDDFVVVNGKEIKFDYLIGADGSSSILRHHLGLKIKKKLTVVQYNLPIKSKKISIFFDSKFFASGYAWAFPYKNFTLVGACVDSRNLEAAELEKNLIEWMKQRKFSIKNANFEAAIINYDYRGYKFGNKFLIGDAGGFASGLTREGIYFARISGKDVANLILNDKYTPKGIEAILRLKKSQERILSLLRFSGFLRPAVIKMMYFFAKREYFKKKILSQIALYKRKL